jgi:formylglycine-generating enzyme required for sulfatase activity
VHTVSLSPFLIAKYECTQGEYAAVMGFNPSFNRNQPQGANTSNHPVEGVSWNDLKNADGFLARTDLSLPSEAQWEYACRAGTSGPYAGNGNIDDMGWYLGNSGGSSHDVGGKQANQFGLHDMHGHVYEWCEDVYKSDFYADDVPGFDPVSTTGSGNRVIRGGNFGRGARYARSAFRDFSNPSGRFFHLGFRPAMPLP